MSYLGKEVLTEYSSDSQYVSSVEGNTPFPSLTLSKKFELEKYINNGQVTYNISTFNDEDIVTPDVDKQADKQQEQKQNSENNGCCLLL